jgi:hypothetical protein
VTPIVVYRARTLRAIMGLLFGDGGNGDLLAGDFFGIWSLDFVTCGEAEYCIQARLMRLLTVGITMLMNIYGRLVCSYTSMYTTVIQYCANI